ncbi:hypothetical protein ZWY2020_035642 [Hordeum vulgare]|nr:hypothetical protein ZWY2020_035642 [Hordeum vulgare]
MVTPGFSEVLVACGGVTERQEEQTRGAEAEVRRCRFSVVGVDLHGGRVVRGQRDPWARGLQGGRGAMGGCGAPVVSGRAWTLLLLLSGGKGGDKLDLVLQPVRSREGGGGAAWSLRSLAAATRPQGSEEA